MYVKRLLLVFLMLIFSTPITYIYAQNRPKFRITKRRKPPSCNGMGIELKQGYVHTSSKEQVDVVLFLQHQNGYWEQKSYTRVGSGYIDLNIMDCDFTGNYYAYCCVTGSTNCNFPDAYEVETLHEAKDQTPKFKVTKLKETTCPDGKTKKFVFEKGYVYSPSGHQVEITLFVEKLDGKWRKKHFFYYGTGNVDIDMEGCDLTGKYRSIVQYTN